ncbi:MAG: hypothetical protein JST94_00850 [Bacteroidetes bacterium]|nr:hypothetical protein [Bacteroidota bacterium]MBS1670002.1 hypothetical protein [Bacteroidota bacterium]
MKSLILLITLLISSRCFSQRRDMGATQLYCDRIEVIHRIHTSAGNRDEIISNKQSENIITVGRGRIIIANIANYVIINTKKLSEEHLWFMVEDTYDNSTHIINFILPHNSNRFSISLNSTKEPNRIIKMSGSNSTEY